MALDTAPTEATQISPTEWTSRTAEIRDRLNEERLPDSALIATLGSFRFRDDQQRLWSYTGATWWVWDSQQWTEMTPPATLSLDAFKYSATAKFARATPSYGSTIATSAVTGTAIGSDTGADAQTTDGTQAADEQAVSDVSDAASSEVTSMGDAAATEAAGLATIAATESDAVADQAVDESSDAVSAAANEEDHPLAAGAVLTGAAWNASDTTDTTDSGSGAVTGSSGDDALGGVDGTIPSMDTATSDSAAADGSAATSSWGESAGAPLAAAAVVGAADAADSVDLEGAPSSGTFADTQSAVEAAPAVEAQPMTEADTASPAAVIDGEYSVVSEQPAGTDDAVIAAIPVLVETQPISTPDAAAPVAAAAVMAAAASEPVAAIDASTGGMDSSPSMGAAPIAAAAMYAASQEAAPTPAPVINPMPAVAAAPAATQPAQPAPAPTPTYRPTHVVPPMGMPAWPQPDPRLQPQFHLAPGLDAMVAEWLPSGWARIICSNGWSGWVDGRQLQPYGQQPAFQR